MTLGEWLKTNRVSHDYFAGRIGSDRSTVTRYANGERIPRREMMAKITKETDGQVTANDFIGTTPDDTEAAA